MEVSLVYLACSLTGGIGALFCERFIHRWR